MVTHSIWRLLYLRGAGAVSGDSCDMAVVVPARSRCGEWCLTRYGGCCTCEEQMAIVELR